MNYKDTFFLLNSEILRRKVFNFMFQTCLAASDLGIKQSGIEAGNKSGESPV